MRRANWKSWNKLDRESARNAAAYKQARKFGGVYGAFVGCVIVLGGVFANLTGISSLLEWIFVYSAVILIALMASRFQFKPMLAWLAERRLERAECAACTFPLDGLSAEADGCTVCPECGAAWKLPEAENA